MTDEQRNQVNYLKDMANEFAKDSYPALALKAGAAALARETNQPKKPALQPLPDHDNHHNALACPYCVKDLAALFDGKVGELHAEVERLTHESKWVRRKVQIPEESKITDLQGRLHVVYAHHQGYENYIVSFKCDDKQGEIARLTAELAKARQILNDIVTGDGEQLENLYMSDDELDIALVDIGEPIEISIDQMRRAIRFLKAQPNGTSGGALAGEGESRT